MMLNDLVTEYLLTRMLSELRMGECLLWLILPAAVQWLILRKTQTRWRGLRLAVLTPALWVLYILFIMLLMLLLGGFLVCLILGEIFRTNFLFSFLRLAVDVLCSKPILYMLARLVLLLAGWGLGWAAYELGNGQLCDPPCGGGPGGTVY